jgi:hypothetical protein
VFSDAHDRPVEITRYKGTTPVSEFSFVQMPRRNRPPRRKRQYPNRWPTTALNGTARGLMIGLLSRYGKIAGMRMAG